MILEASSPLARLSQREHFPGPDDLVFPNVVGGHEQESALRRRYYATHERAGLRRIRFHDLRPTFGTLAVQEFAISDV